LPAQCFETLTNLNRRFEFVLVAGVHPASSVIIPTLFIACSRNFSIAPSPPGARSTPPRLCSLPQHLRSQPASRQLNRPEQTRLVQKLAPRATLVKPPPPRAQLIRAPEWQPGTSRLLYMPYRTEVVGQLKGRLSDETLLPAEGQLYPIRFSLDLRSGGRPRLRRGERTRDASKSWWSATVCRASRSKI
jgi:hypothetical protein